LLTSTFNCSLVFSSFTHQEHEHQKDIANHLNAYLGGV